MQRFLCGCFITFSLFSAIKVATDFVIDVANLCLDHRSEIINLSNSDLIKMYNAYKIIRDKSSLYNKLYRLLRQELINRGMFVVFELEA